MTMVVDRQAFGPIASSKAGQSRARVSPIRPDAYSQLALPWLTCVDVPSADIDERQVELVAHQRADASRRQLRTPCCSRHHAQPPSSPRRGL